MDVSYETMEKLCSEAKTRADWEYLIETYHERDIGSIIADWADRSVYHPHESAGMVSVNEDDFALVASWSDDGFWNVSIETLEDAEKMLDEYENEVYADGLRDEDWLPEDGWGDEDEA